MYNMGPLRVIVCHGSLLILSSSSRQPRQPAACPSLSPSLTHTKMSVLIVKLSMSSVIVFVHYVEVAAVL